MRFRFRFFSPHRFPLLIIVFSFIVTAAIWIFSYFTFPRETPAAILHYSTGIGIDYIGEGNRIIVLPGAATALLVLNLLVWQVVRRASPKAGWIFIGIIPLLVTMLFTAYILLWRLNS